MFHDNSWIDLTNEHSAPKNALYGIESPEIAQCNQQEYILNY